MSEALGVDSIVACAEAVERLHNANLDAGIREIKARALGQKLIARREAVLLQLTHAVPATLTEAFVIASLLARDVEVIGGEKEIHDRIERVAQNLVAGLERMMKADPTSAAFVLPEWLRLPGRDDEIECQEAPNGVRQRQSPSCS